MLISSQQNPSSPLRSEKSPSISLDLPTKQAATTSASAPFGPPLQSSIASPKTLKLSLPQGTGVSTAKTQQAQEVPPKPIVDTDRLLADLEENRGKWDDFWAKVDVSDKRYKFDWSKFCFCKDPSFRGPFTVEVDSDDLNVSWKETGAPAAKYNPDIRPMEGIFASIGRIIRQQPDAMTVDYDPVMGFPTGINVRFGPVGTDGLNITTIENFEFLDFVAD